MILPKYLDKLYLPENYIVIEDDEISPLRTVTENFQEMLNKIGTKYTDKRGFVRLSIYNPDMCDNKIIVDNADSIIDAKNKLVKNTYHRTIFLSPSLDQIYTEVFSLGESADNKICNDGVYNYCFDYGLLYGNYKLFENGEKIKTTYFEKEYNHFISDYIGILNIQVYNDFFIDLMNKPVVLNHDIYYAYSSYALDDEKVEGTIMEISRYDDYNSCIPVATFIK